MSVLTFSEHQKKKNGLELLTKFSSLFSRKPLFKQALRSHFLAKNAAKSLHLAAANDGSGLITALMGRRRPHLMDNH